jgi:hypothetical protein
MAKHLEVGWQAYRRAVIPIDASRVQVEECRRAYLAGASVLFDTVFALLSPDAEPTEEDLRHMQELHDELRGLVASVGKPKPAPPPRIEERYQVRSEAAEAMLKNIGGLLREACPPGYGFALLVFTFEPGAMFYTANAERADMVKAMREFIAKFEEN